VLKWIVERVSGQASANKTPIGYLPRKEDLYIDGLNISDEALDTLLKVDRDEWKRELNSIKEYYAKFDGKLPEELYKQLVALEDRLGD